MSAGPDSSGFPGEVPLKTGIRPLVLTGAAIVFIGIGGAAFWATQAKLNSAALAQGVVAPFSGRQTVQHLEGGIVRDVLVRNGAEVQEGQVLIRLEDTRARATYDLLYGRYLTALANQIRLSSERDGEATLAFPAVFSDTRFADVADAQRRIFQARREAFIGETRLYDQRVQELRREILGINEQKNAAEQQVEIIREQLATVKPLVDQGYARRDRLLGLESRLVEVLGSIGKFAADVSRSEQQIQQTRTSKIQLQKERLQQITSELRESASELADLTERLRSARDVLVRTAIRSPSSGVVTGLGYSTVGGVIPPGEPILDIVPSGDKLVIDAKVTLDDIDVVHKGLPVNIRLTAFSQRWATPLSGEVVDVSPDRLSDPDGTTYFQALVEIDSQALAAASDQYELYPGMSAQLEIVTGERTVLEYLFSPIIESFSRAFREQ